MKNWLPVILIIMGVAEIVFAIMDIKIPTIIILVIGIIFIAFGIKILLDYRKRK